MQLPTEAATALRPPLRRGLQTAPIAAETPYAAEVPGTTSTGLCANCNRRPLEWQLFPVGGYGAVYDVDAPTESPKEIPKQGAAAADGEDRSRFNSSSFYPPAGPLSQRTEGQAALVLFDDVGSSEEEPGEGNGSSSGEAVSSDAAAWSDEAGSSDDTTWNASHDASLSGEGDAKSLRQQQKPCKQANTLQGGMLQFVALVILAHRGLRPHVLMVSRRRRRRTPKRKDFGLNLPEQRKVDTRGGGKHVPKAYLPTFSCGRTSRPETAALTNLCSLVGPVAQVGEFLGHLWITEWGAPALPLLPIHVTRPLRQILLFQAVVPAERQIRLPWGIEGAWVPLELLLTAAPSPAQTGQGESRLGHSTANAHPALKIAALPLHSTTRSSRPRLEGSALSSRGEISGPRAKAVAVCSAYSVLASFVSRFSICTMAAGRTSSTAAQQFVLTAPATRPAAPAPLDAGDNTSRSNQTAPSTGSSAVAGLLPLPTLGAPRSFVAAPEIREEEDLDFDDYEDDRSGSISVPSQVGPRAVAANADQQEGRG